MSDRRAKGCLAAAVIWCVILGVLAVAYRFLVHPYLQEKLKTETSSASSYQHEIVVAADSFSGYAVLRSEAIKQDLKSQQIKLTVQDDRADYTARLEALRAGQVQMAAFTIDSLIAAGAKAGDFPASIVMVIDETKGGDAIVAWKSAVASLQDLNQPDARLVLTPDSPSEFLARVVVAHFNLPNLPSDWRVSANGAKEVYQQFTTGKTAGRRAYVLWEPYVSRALEQSGAHVLIDSARLKGFVVDVLVAQREFLRDHPDLVQKVIEAYGRAAYATSQQPDGWLKLVREDSRLTGVESLTDDQARQVVEGIRWKNTLENYAHFGLVTGASAGGLSTLDDMIGNIMDVLLKTKAITADPLGGQFHTLYYDRVLTAMRGANYHPGRGLNLVDGIGPGSNDLEQVRGEAEAKALTPEQWANLQPVGELRIDAIEFGRGSANISVTSERELQALAKRLGTFPSYYLRVIGHARAEGDPEANRILAQNRAESVARFLESQGLSANRIRTEAATTKVTGGAGQAVSFAVGQVPF